MPPQRYEPLSRPVRGPGLGLAVRKPGERTSPFSHLAEGVLPGAAAATGRPPASLPAPEAQCCRTEQTVMPTLVLAQPLCPPVDHGC